MAASSPAVIEESCWGIACVSRRCGFCVIKPRDGPNPPNGRRNIGTVSLDADELKLTTTDR